MFIDSTINNGLRSSGAQRMVRRTHLPLHCAPLERQNSGWTQAYKHLAPLEPERRFVALCCTVTLLCELSDWTFTYELMNISQYQQQRLQPLER